MKNWFTGDEERGKSKRESLRFSSRGDLKAWLTNDFFKFLLGFSVIIALSFAVLAFAGNG